MKANWEKVRETLQRVADTGASTDAVRDHMAAIAEMRDEIERLTEALVEADRHAATIEALLEPHIQWEKTSS